MSELRSVIEQSSFLQVTATPYSLYSQPNEVSVTNVLEFKPTRPAFTKLVPVPPEYVGGETYFGLSSRSETDTLESLIHHTVDHREFDRLKKYDKRSFKLDDVLTTPAIDGFRRAMVNFIVGGCIQRTNGIAAGAKEKKLRYSFLLHSEAGKGAHSWQEVLTENIIEKLQAAATANDATFASLVAAAYDDLSKSLTLTGQPVSSKAELFAAFKEALTGEHITITRNSWISGIRKSGR